MVLLLVADSKLVTASIAARATSASVFPTVDKGASDVTWMSHAQSRENALTDTTRLEGWLATHSVAGGIIGGTTADKVLDLLNRFVTLAIGAQQSSGATPPAGGFSTGAEAPGPPTPPEVPPDPPP